jgi:hypothetical protein
MPENTNLRDVRDAHFLLRSYRTFPGNVRIHLPACGGLQTQCCAWHGHVLLCNS